MFSRDLHSRLLFDGLAKLSFCKGNNYTRFQQKFTNIDIDQSYIRDGFNLINSKKLKYRQLNV